MATAASEEASEAAKAATAHLAALCPPDPCEALSTLAKYGAECAERATSDLLAVFGARWRYVLLLRSAASAARSLNTQPSSSSPFASFSNGVTGDVTVDTAMLRQVLRKMNALYSLIAVTSEAKGSSAASGSGSGSIVGEGVSDGNASFASSSCSSAYSSSSSSSDSYSSSGSTSQCAQWAPPLLKRMRERRGMGAEAAVGCNRGYTLRGVARMRSTLGVCGDAAAPPPQTAVRPPPPHYKKPHQQSSTALLPLLSPLSALPPRRRSSSSSSNWCLVVGRC